MSETPAALVTGGSRGIGRAICLALGRMGWNVAVNYARRVDAAEEVVAAIEAAGASAAALQGDIADASDRERMIEQAIDRFGRLDLLVNNAAMGSPNRTDVLELSGDDWDAVFATNLKGPFFLSQLAARRMIKLIGAGKMRGGKIINISSISAYAASTNRAEYCMAKAALHMMTQVFALRLAEERIQVFEVSPGVIRTDMTAGVAEKYGAMIDAGLTPIRRWGEPEDIAAAVEAIVSDRFPFSTGQRFDVDGGFHIRSF
ncbi:MAG: 3-ketoacyl-ACP reductase [Planctomycetota bacterium]|nr:MAG: 3-ketoacyl-ACP reductase [Planctomycetota bacterium]REK29908.1 MAG: 3-ketoacyl-ACP reductase [Planctomycetota bacterium]